MIPIDTPCKRIDGGKEFSNLNLKMENRVAAPVPWISSFDVLKTIAILAVICLHTFPFKYSADVFSSRTLLLLSVLFEKTCRFAVPIFFMISGFLFERARQRGTPVGQIFRKSAGRLIFLFVCWSVFYGIFTEHCWQIVARYGFIRGLPRAVYWDTVTFIKTDPIHFILQGTCPHLWFLMGLVISLGLLAFFFHIKKERFIWPVGIGLYVLGTLNWAYLKTPVGISIHFDTRLGPFLGFIFTAVGWWLAKRKIPYPMRTALAVLVVGFLLQMAEALVLYRFFGTIHYDYTLSTLPFSIGIFLIALAAPQIGTRWVWHLAGSLVLGIYLVHYFFITALLPFRSWICPPAWDLCFPILIFMLSAITVSLLKVNRITRKFII